MMNIRDLQYLVALAEHRHFSRAAEACFVSQPGLSMQIKKLEETLKVPLVERTNSKAILLTPTGVKIAERAKLLLHQIEEIHEIAKLARDPTKSELKLGIVPTVAPYLLPHIMPIFSKIFPQLSLYLLENKTKELLEKLTQGKIEAAILSLHFPSMPFISMLLFEEEFMLAVPAKHEMSKQKFLTLADLKNKTLLLLEEGHCLRDQALAICHTAQATEMKYFQTTSLETLRYMVQKGVGITLMPKLACKKDKHIIYIPFRDHPKPSRQIVMLWRTSTVKEVLLTEIAYHIKLGCNL